MSRKRTLYLSELLNRNVNKDLQVQIISKTIMYFNNVQDSIKVLQGNKLLDMQVQNWSIVHSTLTCTLIVQME